MRDPVQKVQADDALILVTVSALIILASGVAAGELLGTFHSFYETECQHAFLWHTKVIYRDEKLNKK